MLKTTSGSSTAYGWDAVNRMTSLSVSGVATSYAYRADGMRVKKIKGADVTRSYYDGQMPVEEDWVVSGTSSVTRNFVGARGIEAIFTTTTSGTTTAFPLYDCHGNMVATVARSGAGFVTSNVRTYDVWGEVRTGASTVGPKGRYVANLGYVQDDESDLIYMRARYYEPESGRFINEYPAMDGSNLYRYCNSNPILYIEKGGTIAELTGNSDYFGIMLSLGYCEFGFAGMFLSSFMTVPTPADKAVGIFLLPLAAFHLSEALGETDFSFNRYTKFMDHAQTYIVALGALASALQLSKYARFSAHADKAMAFYSLVILALIKGGDLLE